ncbi:chloride channel K isoform X2 [Cynoglossus semilaevis]|uniref:chloride channel K isoform X2 n=1 Tax=Cynoglossus semilaevis TaxID=244447 RepID=UPI000D62DFAB|nr:chloride channel protein ClC-Kb isoform X2 [Cynoglossus semilaevis]
MEMVGEERENQYETSHYKSSLISDPWKPCRRTRAVVKECLLKLSCCLGAVCGMHWYGYAALGIVMAFISFFMDLSVTKLLRAHQWLYVNLEGNNVLQFFCWTLYPACLCAVGSLFSQNISPFSTGSGIPEVRTMLVGIQMSHYLSLTNMFTKFLGLICTLAAGSTVFLGKVGPFVHLSTMVGEYLSNLCSLVQNTKKVKPQVIQKDKAAKEMMVVSAAVGVAGCFGAPISGVLFSVEVMCSHFAVKHYGPCFLAAACGALTFCLFTVWSGDEETLQPLFKTNFPAALPFYPLEILLFASLGLLCGAVSCCYLFCHRWMLQFTKTKEVFIKMLTTEKCLYSGLVVFLLASVTFPHSAGQYMASQYTMKQLLTSLLDSSSWSSHIHNTSVPLEPDTLSEWNSSGRPVYLSLVFFLFMKMWMLVLACTLPVPAGYFMPVFVYGAVLGRLHGELAAYLFSGGGMSFNPGGYALAGAAAFSGAVTHTMSPALLAIELTGQFAHALPVLLSTLLANAVSRSGQRPSFYDAISISKKLPHLPSMKKVYPQLPLVEIGQFLGSKQIQLQKTAGLEEIQHVVNSSSDTQYPVVDTHESQIFLGFVHRSELLIFLSGCETETVEKHLDDICCIHPSSVLLSPHSTVQEVR